MHVHRGHEIMPDRFCALATVPPMIVTYVRKSLSTIDLSAPFTVRESQSRGHRASVQQGLILTPVAVCSQKNRGGELTSEILALVLPLLR